MNPGPYHPLESHEEIRVVYLRPGKDDDAIRIELKHLHRGHLVRYEALSYVWGTALATQAIIVNDTHDLIINENLDIVLRHLRLLNRVRILWIDAICINQSDLEERTQQVQMMGLIYSKAYEVIIWLGPDEGYNYHNLLLHIDKLTRPNSSASFVRLIREMCQLGSSPWFSRVWVAQELVLASKDPMVYIGHYRIPWSILGRGIEHLSELFWGVPQEITTIEDEVLIRDFMMCSTDVSAFHHQRLRGKKAPFAERLIDTEFAQATDPRDKIYGVLAMSKFKGSPLRPDYTLTIQELLIQTTEILLRDGWPGLYGVYPLHYMRNEDSPRLKKIPNLPSWVPDMILQSKFNREELDHQEQYWKPRKILRGNESIHVTLGKLCNKLPESACAAYLSHNSTTLVATGQALGKLTWKSSPNFFHGPGAAMRLNALYHGTLKGKGFTVSTFYRALHDEEDDYHFFQHMWAFEEFLVYQNVSAEDISFHYLYALEAVLEGASKRTLFITDSGYLGQTYHPDPDGVQQGDSLVGLFGINFPFVIHPVDDQRFRMINVAHVVDHQWGYTPQMCNSQEYELL